jgi:hypothetical protein
LRMALFRCPSARCLAALPRPRGGQSLARWSLRWFLSVRSFAHSSSVGWTVTNRFSSTRSTPLSEIWPRRKRSFHHPTLWRSHQVIFLFVIQDCDSARLSRSPNPPAPCSVCTICCRIRQGLPPSRETFSRGTSCREKCSRTIIRPLCCRATCCSQAFQPR